MRQWRRVPTDTICGGPHGQPVTIPKGDPALFISLPNVKHERIRCEACEGPAPPDLPAQTPRAQQFTKPLRPLRTTAQQFTRERLTQVAAAGRDRYGETR